MHFFKDARISAKIFGGFGIVLLLLIVISLTGGLNLNNGNTDFKRYRAIALQTNQAGEVQANLLEARLAAMKFMQEGSQDAVTAVTERGETTLKLAEALSAMVNSPEKKAIVANAEEELGEYLKAFDQLTKLRAERTELVKTGLNKIGPGIVKTLNGIMSGAEARGDMTTAFHTAEVLQSLMIMRLHISRFIRENDPDVHAKVLKEEEAATKHIEDLGEKLQNPEDQQALNKVDMLLASYFQTYESVYTSVVEENTIYHGTLSTIGPKIAAEMEELKLAIKQEQDTLGPQASAAMENAVYITAGAAGISLVLGILAAWLIGAGISGPVQMITRAMKTLAGGDKSTAIPGLDRKDEIGAMASAVQVFKENMIKADEMAERETREAGIRDARAKRIEALTSDFDSGVSELLSAVASASTEMENTASSMSTIANDTNHRATTVASAAEEASTNVQTVASATEELTGSIHEISRQVSQSAEIAGRAVTQAEQTDGQVRGLADAAQRIGEVVSLISAIAEQTNLLALNATIEAARAGEAGRGFAVVASEVKNLATQTAKATEEISQQVGSIQSETLEAVTAIQSIGTIIKEVNDIAAGIAAAVEEQSAATGEIARNVEQASIGTQEVSTNIVEVTHAASETGAAASQVTSVAGDLNMKADELKAKVERFLADVRAA
ncbi:MAG: methyl-accepting chemotaxis protein [Hyphomicrobiales bacterium]|nr:MAG: methyl-accepting chemotaxis protein [Hyphomicrobiales bacterium]